MLLYPDQTVPLSIQVGRCDNGQKGENDVSHVGIVFGGRLGSIGREFA